MLNRIFILIIFDILFISCNPNYKRYEVLNRIYSKDKDIFIEVRKYGINSGATVGYLYKFYIKDNKQSFKKCFITTKGNIKYKIKWSSINTVEIVLNSGDLELFKGVIHSKNIKYIITKFNYLHN